MDSLTVLQGQLDELETLIAERVLQGQLVELATLIAEARELRKRHVEEACVRVARCLEVGIRPVRDDALLIQQFIGQRIAQDRYGR